MFFRVIFKKKRNFLKKQRKTFSNQLVQGTEVKNEGVKARTDKSPRIVILRLSIQKYARLHGCILRVLTHKTMHRWYKTNRLQSDRLRLVYLKSVACHQSPIPLANPSKDKQLMIFFENGE